MLRHVLGYAKKLPANVQLFGSSFITLSILFSNKPIYRAIGFGLLVDSGQPITTPAPPKRGNLRTGL